MQQLLQGSGLAVRRVGAEAVTLEATTLAQADSEVIVTDTLSVAGDRVDSGASSDEARLLDSYRSVGSTTTLSRAHLERFRGTSNGDIIKGVAGVTAGDPRVGNGFDVNIRGIQGQGRVPVIIDGGQSSMDTYRGYAGQSQRTYLDPDLISSLTISKGPSLQANASGGIGGVVEMETLKIGDVLREGRDVGVRVRGGLANGSANNLPSYSAAPRTDRSATGSQFFNVAAAGHWDRFDLVAAYAYRDNGNYFSGRHGYDDFPQTRRTLAPLNPPRTEVFNTSSRSKSALLRAPGASTTRRRWRPVTAVMKAPPARSWPRRSSGWIVTAFRSGIRATSTWTATACATASTRTVSGSTSASMPPTPIPTA